MTKIFRLSGATKWNAEIDQWLADQEAELGAIALVWFSRLRECGDDVVELMHDGCPVACVGDAPFGYVNVFKAHVNLGFFHGADLADEAGLLEGTGKYMRHVKLKPDREPDQSQLMELIESSYLDIKNRL
jgi:hypothetical protein